MSATKSLTDWTADEQGRSNSSQEFREIAAVVEEIIRGDAHMLIGGRADATARLIVANLSHRFGMTPSRKDRSHG